MQAAQFNQSMVDFIQASPTPYHAVHEMRKQLSENGFELLDEGDAWQLQAGKRYMVSRNDSSLIAFVYGKQSMVENGLRMVGAHTDSPCLRVKPNSDVFSAGYWQVGVEVYGGVLLAPWFDRELGLAGRVAVLDVHGDLHHVLIDFKKAVGMIPSLAIHLDREVNKNRSINPQKELPVLLGLARNKKDDELLTFVLHQVEEQYPDIDIM
jgi:aspartyl aminopeptidase